MGQFLELTYACYPCHRRTDQLRVGQRRQRHEEHAAGEPLEEFGSHLECKSCLAAAAGTGERDEPFPVREQCNQLRQLRLTADEGARGDRQVRRVEALQRRKVAVAELVDPLGSGQVFEPVLAEVA